MNEAERMVRLFGKDLALRKARETLRITELFENPGAFLLYERILKEGSTKVKDELKKLIEDMEKL